MPDKKDDKKQAPVLPVYESQPPAWLPPIHAVGDLGTRGEFKALLSGTNIDRYRVPRIPPLSTWPG